MLNKEMLLNSGKKAGHVIMTVGAVVPDDTAIGYINDKFGSLNRIPYWIGISPLEPRSALRQITCSTTQKISTMKIGDKYTKTKFTLHVLVNGKNSDIFNLRMLGRSTVEYETFNWATGLSYGSNVTLEFDPPPTDIYNSSDHLFNGGGLDVRKGITTNKYKESNKQKLQSFHLRINRYNFSGCKRIRRPTLCRDYRISRVYSSISSNDFRAKCIRHNKYQYVRYLQLYNKCRGSNSYNANSWKSSEYRNRDTLVTPFVGVTYA